MIVGFHRVEGSRKLAANFEGNEFTPGQLGDFVSVQLAR